jgi:hypothetical protein
MCIQVRNSLTGEPLGDWEFYRGRSVVSVKTSGRLLVTEVGTLLRVCLDGVGIARIKAIGVQELLDQGKLVELFPAWSGDTFPLYALYPSRHCRRPRSARSSTSCGMRSRSPTDARSHGDRQGHHRGVERGAVGAAAAGYGYSGQYAHLRFTCP